MGESLSVIVVPLTIASAVVRFPAANSRVQVFDAVVYLSDGDGHQIAVVCCAQQTGMRIVGCGSTACYSIVPRCNERLKYTMPVQAVAGR
jgi:hypothetical protein